MRDKLKQVVNRRKIDGSCPLWIPDKGRRSGEHTCAETASRAARSSAGIEYWCSSMSLYGIRLYLHTPRGRRTRTGTPYERAGTRAQIHCIHQQMRQGRIFDPWVARCDVQPFPFARANQHTASSHPFGRGVAVAPLDIRPSPSPRYENGKRVRAPQGRGGQSGMQSRGALRSHGDIGDRLSLFGGLTEPEPSANRHGRGLHGLHAAGWWW